MGVNVCICGRERAYVKSISWGYQRPSASFSPRTCVRECVYVCGWKVQGKALQELSCSKDTLSYFACIRFSGQVALFSKQTGRVTDELEAISYKVNDVCVVCVRYMYR